MKCETCVELSERWSRSVAFYSFAVAALTRETRWGFPGEGDVHRLARDAWRISLECFNDLSQHRSRECLRFIAVHELGGMRRDDRASKP